MSKEKQVEDKVPKVVEGFTPRSLPFGKLQVVPDNPNLLVDRERGIFYYLRVHELFGPRLVQLNEFVDYENLAD